MVSSARPPTCQPVGPSVSVREAWRPSNCWVPRPYPAVSWGAHTAWGPPRQWEESELFCNRWGLSSFRGQQTQGGSTTAPLPPIPKPHPWECDLVLTLCLANPQPSQGPLHPALSLTWMKALSHSASHLQDGHGSSKAWGASWDKVKAGTGAAVGALRNVECEKSLDRRS